jgi:hypothetical protein
MPAHTHNDHRQPLTAYLEQYRGILDGLLRDATADLLSLKFDGRHAHHLAAVAIYATILQSVGECATIARDPTTITIGTVVRSVLESYADLCAVISDVGYIERLLATLINEKRRLLASMIRSPDNPFHEDLAMSIDAAADLPERQAELKALADRGIVPLRVEDRFHAAGKQVEDLYGSLYWQLCLQGHNNISAIENRHVRLVAENLAEVRIYDPRPVPELIMYYNSLVGVFAGATERIHDFLQSGLDGKYRERGAQNLALGVEALGADVDA